MPAPNDAMLAPPGGALCGAAVQLATSPKLPPLALFQLNCSGAALLKTGIVAVVEMPAQSLTKRSMLVFPAAAAL